MSKYTKTEFVHIPEGPNTEDLYNIYSKISHYDVYATAPDINWLGNKNKNIQKEMAWDISPSMLLIKNERNYYNSTVEGLSYEVEGYEYNDYGEKGPLVVYPTQLSTELSKKQWECLFELWDKEFSNLKGKTKSQKEKIKYYLALIKIMKEEDLLNNLAICDVIV